MKFTALIVVAILIVVAVAIGVLKLLKKGENAVAQTRSFRMTIDDVFALKTRGVVVVGIISEGTVTTGDDLILETVSGRIAVRVDGIEIGLSNRVRTAHEGDSVGIGLVEVEKSQISSGDTVVRE